MKSCPFCQLPLLQARTGGDATLVECKRCGEFILTESAQEDLSSILRKRDDARPLVSHFVRRRQLSQKRPKITSDWIQKVVDEQTLPSPPERVGYLVLALGDTKVGVGESQPINPEAFMALVGATSAESFDYLVKHLVEEGLVEGSWADWTGQTGIHPKGMLIGRLTIKGWEQHSVLRRTGGAGTRAFIAMKFGDPELDGMLREHFRPAVLRTGFELRRLDDEPRAGLIDDRLRVEIRQSRFLLADLTHANNGAYWEAGYAEGLGKPVIYLCKKAIFDDPAQRPHFDTNHHLTITWDVETIKEDMDRLVATIRFSIPESRQVDDMR